MRPQGQREPFHGDADIRIAAMWVRLVRQGIYNMDEYRHAIERMEPRHYMSASYYERTFTAVASLCVERGLFTAAELSAAAGFPIALALPSQPGRVAPEDLPDFEVGERVRVKEEFVPGHIRMPGYIRGKTGVVVGVSPAYPYPDAHGHGLASPWQRTFDVCFSSQDLWPDGAEEAQIHVGVFHAYLDKLA